MSFYIKHTDKNNLFDVGHGSIVLFEIIDNYAMRQLMLSKDKIVGSNRKD